jgi:uncharacterized damage-inducible protein DinB
VRLLDALLPEFDHEVAVTRRVIERAPEAAFGWRPHEKSWSLGGLVTHLATLPRWGVAILQYDAHDVVRQAGGPRPEKTTLADVLATFDENTRHVRAALADAPDAALLQPWALKRDGALVLSVPRIQAFKSFVVSHLVHHRGQLTVYLRMQDVPLPPIYGPTADEPL